MFPRGIIYHNSFFWFLADIPYVSKNLFLFLVTRETVTHTSIFYLSNVFYLKAIKKSLSTKDVYVLINFLN